jgi:hypothetical protein
MTSGSAASGHEVPDMWLLQRLAGIAFFALVAASTFWICPPVAQAGSGLTALPQFEHFCSSWMGKLAERERQNLQTAAPRRDGANVVVQYVGYGKTPTRCEARTSGVPSNPFVGKLVYSELRYQRAGATRERALASEPRVLEQTEVMEIFRFDGSRWVY